MSETKIPVDKAVFSSALWAAFAGLAVSQSANAAAPWSADGLSQSDGLPLAGGSSARSADASVVGDQLAVGQVDLVRDESADVTVQGQLVGLDKSFDQIIDSYLKESSSLNGQPAGSASGAWGAEPVVLAQASTASSSTAAGAAASSPAAGASMWAATSPSVVALGLGGVALLAVVASEDDPAAKTNLGGVAVDGYLAKATAFYDANGNGVLDSGEVSTTTDSAGNFDLTGVTETAAGRIVVQGGVDVLTGKAFTGQLVAASSGTNVVVSPLTTLVASGAITEAALKTALGIDASVSLSTLDPMAGMKSSDPAVAAAAEKVLISAQQVFTVVSAAVASGSTLSAAATSLATNLNGSTLAAATNAVITSADAAAAVNSVNTAISTAMEGKLAAAYASGDGAAVVDAVKIVVVAQTSLVADVTAGTASSTTYDSTAIATKVAVATISLSADNYDFFQDAGINIDGADVSISDQATLDALVAEMEADGRDTTGLTVGENIDLVAACAS